MHETLHCEAVDGFHAGGLLQENFIPLYNVGEEEDTQGGRDTAAQADLYSGDFGVRDDSDSDGDEVIHDNADTDPTLTAAKTPRPPAAPIDGGAARDVDAEQEEPSNGTTTQQTSLLLKIIYDIVGGAELIIKFVQVQLQLTSLDGEFFRKHFKEISCTLKIELRLQQSNGCSI